MNARDRQVAKETVRPPAECPACHPENFQQEGPPPNRFAEAQTVTELIYRVVGAASTCWVNGTGPAEFDTTQAIAVADDAIDRLIELGWAPPGAKALPPVSFSLPVRHGMPYTLGTPPGLP